MKVVVPVFESIQQSREATDLAVRGGFHPAQPLVPAFGQMNFERAVGPERRVDGHGKTRAGDALVMTKVIGRVVGSAESGHPKAPQNPACREIGACQHLVGARPYRGSRAFIQQFIDAEIPLQFEVGPVVERVA
jgi:hypothetical protein